MRRIRVRFTARGKIAMECALAMFLGVAIGIWFVSAMIF